MELEKSMNPTRENPKTTYLYDTPVENLFISEYMADMPGDYVKVYLFLLMKSSLYQPVSLEEVEKTLHLEKEQGEKALTYLKEMGIVTQRGTDIQMEVLKEKLYGTGDEVPRRSSGENKELYNPEIKDMLSRIEKTTGRYASGGEMKNILFWLQEEKIPPKIIVKAYEYCKKKGKDHYRYVDKVLATWQKKGLLTVSEVEDFLEESDQRHYTYRRIGQALGFQRNLTEKEREVIDGWLDHYDFSMGAILKACDKTAGITNPNINYVNAVLTGNRNKTDKTSKKNQIKELYQQRRKEREDQAKKRKEEVYKALPEIEDIDRQLSQYNIDLTTVLIGGGNNKGEKIREIKQDVEKLEEKRKHLLTKNNYPIDVTAVKYYCSRCQDTGIGKEGQQCTCLEEVKKAVEEMD